jgi:hypothetical protein
MGFLFCVVKLNNKSKNPLRGHCAVPTMLEKLNPSNCWYESKLEDDGLAVVFCAADGLG